MTNASTVAGLETLTLRPKQVYQVLIEAIKLCEPVLVTGKPGIGKSDIMRAACEATGADFILSHPVVADPTDAKGLPWPQANGETATFLPYGDLAKALHATQRTVWCLDDLGQASPATQASYMQLLLAREVNNHKLSEHVTFLAASNRRIDRAGVSGLLEPVKSRFATIIELEPTVEDFCEWALTHHITPECPAFLRFRPSLLCAFTPTPDLKNSPCPRTWVKASKWLGKVPRELEFPVIAGAVGEGAAAEFVAFLRTYRDLPDPDDLMKRPESARIPTELSALYALTSALAYRASVQTFAAIYTYAERLRVAGHAEFGVLLLKDSYLHDPKIATTKAFMDLIVSPYGKLIKGD